MRPWSAGKNDLRGLLEHAQLRRLQIAEMPKRPPGIVMIYNHLDALVYRALAGLPIPNHALDGVRDGSAEMHEWYLENTGDDPYVPARDHYVEVMEAYTLRRDLVASVDPELEWTRDRQAAEHLILCAIQSVDNLDDAMMLAHEGAVLLGAEGPPDARRRGRR